MCQEKTGIQLIEDAIEKLDENAVKLIVGAGLKRWSSANYNFAI
jgi:hypothetical protein